MKIAVCLILLAGFFIDTTKAQVPVIHTDSIRFYFNEVKQATYRHKYLWNKDLYGPMLLVDPVARWVYANEPDNAGLLTFKDSIYTGTLPREFGAANTSIEWNRKNWAMILLPLPKNQYDRTDLIVHELFHSAQPSLGFDLPGSDNHHLDQRDGRIYLRLELAALEEALKGRTLQESEEHIQNALLFRKYRHLLYRSSAESENRMELLEGLPTYTGQVMSGRSRAELREYLRGRLALFKAAPSFVRSFAYETVPVYGFFLSMKNDHWNMDITSETDLTDYFSEAFGLDQRIVLRTFVQQVAEEYGGKAIEAAEIARSEKNMKRVEEYQKLFLDTPHLEIGLENVNVEFNPLTLVPLEEDEGIVYPTARLSDRWGVLSVTRVGVLLGPGNRWAIVSEPVEIQGNGAVGDGWTLQLNQGYYVEKLNSGDYRVARKK